MGQLDESNIAINLTFSLGKLAFRLENWPISQENVYFLSKTDLLARKRVFSAGDARFRWENGVQKSNIIAIVAVLAGNIQYQYLLSCKSIFIQSLKAGSWARCRRLAWAPRVEAARRDAHCSVQAGRDHDQGARRARRLQAVGRELRGLGMVAAFGAAGVTWCV